MPDTVSDEPREVGFLRRTLHRFTASEHELDAEDLEGQISEFGALPCRDAAGHERERACIVGRLKSVRFVPHSNAPTLEAELYDGTGTVSLIWLGRRRIAGIEPGRTLVVRGRISDQGLRRVIFNPWYELRPASR